MKKMFTENGWKDYIYWLKEDKLMIKKINSIIEDIEQNGNQGTGKPEMLRGNMAGCYSRRISDKERLVYRTDEENIYILACRYHYEYK